MATNMFDGLKRPMDLTGSNLFYGVPDFGNLKQFNKYEKGYQFIRIVSIPKYLEKLDRLNVSYIVYHFNNEKEMLVEECRNDGEYHKEKRPNQNCLLCSGLRRYSEDKYMNAFRKMLEQELKGCE